METLATHVRAALANFNQAPPRLSWKTSLLSFALFILFYFSMSSAPTSPLNLALLLVVILFHELGHLIAMKAFGYRNTQIFFLPGFGAATSGHRGEATPLAEAVVSLAGPVPGIIVALTLFFVNQKIASGSLTEAVKLFAGINALNLLPFYPLDGWHTSDELYFQCDRQADLVIHLLGGFLVGISALIPLQPGVLLFCALSVQAAFQRLNEGRDLDDSIGDWKGITNIDAMKDEEFHGALSQLVKRFPSEAANMYAARMRQLARRARLEELTIGKFSLLLFIHVGAFVMGVIAYFSV